MKARWLFLWLACLGLALAAASGALWLLYVMQEPAARIDFARMLSTAAPLLTIAALLVAVFCGMLAHGLTRLWFLPIRRYASTLRVMASGNPECRLEPAAGREFGDLAAAINELAARHQGALGDVQSQIAQANAGLAREHGYLTALMSDLAQSVIVCNAEGTVLLYNEQARQLFGASGDSGFLGLGRPVYELLSRETLIREFAGVCARLAGGEPHPVTEFEIKPAGPGRVHARMAPVRSDDATSTSPQGYVLLLSAGTALPCSPAEASAAGGEGSRITPSARPPATPARPIFYDFDLFHQADQTVELDDRPLRELAYTAFDTETTGLEPSEGDEIISIGAVRIVNARLLESETYEQLVDPRRPLKPDSMRVHGITPDKLVGKPTIDSVLPRFHRFCQNTVLIGHNAAFDMRFLQLKETASGVQFTAPILDTLLLSSALHGDTLEHRLDDIAIRLGIEPERRHTALGDALTTARVFLKLIPLLEAQGLNTLRQARDASARTLHARIRY